MTREELRQEAEIFVSEKADKGNFDVEKFGKAYFSESSMKQALINFAEPREKRIEELIALINAERERQEKCDDVHLRTIADLEKENERLTDELKALRESIKDYGVGCYENGLRNGKRKLEE